MIEIGLYTMAAHRFNNGKAGAGEIQFMWNHGGFEQDDWIILY